MSADPTPATDAGTDGGTAEAPPPRRRRARGAGHTMLGQGEPMLWLTGGALAVCMAMIVGLLVLVLWQGMTTFWPRPVVRVVTHDGAVRLGEVTRWDTYRPSDEVIGALPEDVRAEARAELAANDGWAGRRLVRTGNYQLTNEHFNWVSDFETAEESLPEWALVIERVEWGNFYGTPVGFKIDDELVAEDAPSSWARFGDHHEGVLDRRAERRDLEEHAVGRINLLQERARLAVRQAELDHGEDSPEAAAARAVQEEVLAETGAEYEGIRDRIAELNAENARFALVMRISDGRTVELPLSEVVRAYPANRLGFWDKLGVYLSRWGEFLADDPREANMEGGVFPAIFGTVVMTLLMSLAVVPIGVLGALYLREYAKSGPMISTVRIAVNNLAGVPSIVFGVFGLGFFCYMVGGTVDEVFFEARLPSPTFGTGGVFWASLTLALLTLPVVIVATEEALAAVPGSMRQGSYACGASKWQTIRRIVLPRAMPGIMTGAILAMARGAGEVAPLMLVGAVKTAPSLPVDGVFPYVHLERSFMHLGFHIYDLGFQSPNSEAAKPMVFTTTLLLIGIVFVLNLTAIWLRTRLRRKFTTGQF